MTLPGYVISLPRRKDRREAFTKAWNASSAKDVVDIDYLPAVEVPDHITGPERIGLCDIACAVSHRKAVALAHARGLEGVVVFEDDAIPVNSGRLGKFLFEDLAAVSGWQTANLGGCSAQWRPATPKLRFGKRTDNVIGVCGMVTTHAIVYHRSVFDDILAAVPSEAEFVHAAGSFTTTRPYDQWLGSHRSMVTGTIPFFVQSGSSSDILGAPHGVSVADLIESTYKEIRSAITSNQYAASPLR